MSNNTDILFFLLFQNGEITYNTLIHVVLVYQLKPNILFYLTFCCKILLRKLQSAVDFGGLLDQFLCK